MSSLLSSMKPAIMTIMANVFIPGVSSIRKSAWIMSSRDTLIMTVGMQMVATESRSLLNLMLSSRLTSFLYRSSPLRSMELPDPDRNCSACRSKLDRIRQQIQ